MSDFSVNAPKDAVDRKGIYIMNGKKTVVR